MITVALALLSMAGATLVPVYVALYLFTNLKVQTRYLAALGLGLAVWFFFDTFNDANQLDVNQQFTGGLAHVAHVLIFMAGITMLAIFDYFVISKPSDHNSSQNSQQPYVKSLVLIPIAIALVMGIHSAAEGIAFGGEAAAVGTGTIVNAFGNSLALISYPVHKFSEATIIACAYAVYVKRTIAMKKWWHLPVIGLLFGGTSVIGTAAGYFVHPDVTFYYAFGVTAGLYAIIRLSEAVNLRFKVGENAPSYLGWKVFVAIMIGFFMLYFAGLLH